MRTRLAALAALLAAAGCDLRQDISTVRFQLLPVTYLVSTELLHVPPVFWRLRCTPERNTCCEVFDCAAIPLLCREQACVTDFSFETYGTIDMRAAAPAVTRLKLGEVAALTVSRLRFDARNQLNVDLPPLSLYLAPVEVITASHPDAERFATIPALPARSRVDDGVLDVSAESQEAFARYARKWGVFNLIVTAPVSIQSTQTPLRGFAAMDVIIEISATLDL